MREAVELVAETRTATGKGAARQLRRTGRVPAVLYGQGTSPTPLAVDGETLGHLLERISPENTIVELMVDGRRTKTLIREIQRHPVKPGILHVDFNAIRADEKLRLEVTVHLVGTPDGVRNQGGTLDQVLRTVEIEVLPADIPERVELDTTALTIGHSLHVGDLVIPNAHILTNPALTVCTVTAPRVEEVAAAPVAAEGVEGVVPAEAAAEPPAEPELIRRKKPEEEEPEE